MNWTRLKISTIFFIIAGLFYPDCSSARPTNRSSNTDTDTIIHSILIQLPKQSPSFFKSYNAVTLRYFEVKTSSNNSAGLISETQKRDTDQIKNEALYSAETLTYQKRLKPDLIQSENLSAKEKGNGYILYKELATCLDSFSLLLPINNLSGISFQSPFSKVSASDYAYMIADSVTVSGDSLYSVSFRPESEKRLSGFIGTALIDAKNFAIRSINARSTQHTPQDPLIIINQNFEKIETNWLPQKKIINVFFQPKSAENKAGDESVSLVAEYRATIYQQQINPSLSPGDFRSGIQPSEKKITTQEPSGGNFTYTPLNQNDSLSNLIGDSLLTHYREKQQLRMIRLMAEGKVSLGFFNFDYDRLIGYNLFEGIKLGFGGETNSLLSRYFTVGGYIGYGLKDQSLQHGEWINLYPAGHPGLRIHLGFKDMNLEFGGPEFLENKSLLNPESYRSLLIRNMIETKRYTVGFELMPYSDLKLYFFGDRSKNKARQDSPFLLSHPFDPVNLTRTGLQLRYSPGIKLQSEEDEVVAPKTDLFATIVQGLSIFGGEFRYTKLELKGKFELPYTPVGTTTIMLRGGIMTQNAPIIELFNGYGSFAGTFSLAAPYSFATMQQNEFSASNFAAIHLRHDFSTWLFPETFKKRPAFIFAQNIGAGRMNDQSVTQYNVQDYRKGFYESGFEINNLLRTDYLTWGFGIYYRYGPYQFSTIHENFAYKFGFYFKL